MLTSTEQNELHNLLRRQGNLTQDGCWDAIEVFEEFLKEKLKPLSEDKLDVLAEANITDEGIAGYYLGFRDAEKHHGIGGGNE
jgi:hypothetical protein